MRSNYSISIILITTLILMVWSLPNEVDTRLEYIYSNYRQSDTGNAYSVHRFSTDADEYLELSTSGGSVKIKGADVDEAEIRMFVRRGRSYLTENDTDLSNFDIKIAKEGNKIIAVAERKNIRQSLMNRNNESISFEVLVPNRYNIDVRTSGGSIALDELSGILKARTAGGSLSLNNLGGNIHARTSGGTIYINESGGIIDVKTSGGSITAKNSAGTLKLSTSGGSIHLDNVCGKVDASTSGGSIKANILKVDGAISLKTSGGSIQTSLPGGLGYDLDLAATHVTAPLHNFTGESKRNRVTGTMNGGGLPVTLKTSGGNVNLTWN
jgi:hypothetical protein